MIDIFVSFYSQNWFSSVVLALLRDCLASIERFTDLPHQVYILDNGSDKEVVEELKKWDWPLIVNDNPAKCYSTLMNKAICSAKSDPFVCLHGDMKVTKNWLKTLVEEHKYCEEYFGCPCCLIPSFLHYEVEENHIVWKEGGSNLLTPAQMRKVCFRYHIPYRPGTGVISKLPYKGPIKISGTRISDDGSNMMSFIITHAFFKTAGLYDEDFTSFGWEDNEMGIRALMKGLKVLKTHSVFVHHAPAASAGRGPGHTSGANPHDVFVKKYGKQAWNAMESGQLWITLHKKQYIKEESRSKKT